MFIWTINDIVGLGILAIFAIGFGLLFLVVGAQRLWRKIKFMFRGSAAR